MSLPATHKDTTDKPAANAVANPTDAKAKNADIDRKMRMYGVVEAMRNGRYPSNKQCDDTLNYVINNSPFDESKLSKDGKQLIEDVRAIINTAKIIVDEKNADELVQNFLYHTRRIDTDSHAQNIKGLASAGPSGEEAQNDGQEAAQALRTLGKLIYTSSEARKLLKDAGVLARDVAADAAVKAADTARPSEQQLNQVDEPAPANEWIGPDGTKHSHEDPVPDTGLAAKREQAQQAKQDAQNQAQQARDRAAAEGADAADRRQAGGPDANQEIVDEKSNKLKSAYGDAVGKIPEQHKEKARQARDDTKDYLKDKFPQERRDRFIFRAKKVIVEQQRHRDYQDAIETLLGLLETYQGHAKNASGDAANKAGDVTNDPAFQKPLQELRQLLERFANGASMQPVIDAVDQIYQDARDDPQLRGWFSKLDTFMRKVLQEPGFVMRDECDTEGRALRESGRQFWSEKYAGHRETLFNEIQNFFTSYADDPLNTRLGQDVKKLTKDLFLNAEGNLQLKPHLWSDIVQIILPELVKKIGYVPIPRIEYTDPQIDLVIENLTIEAQNLLPNSIAVDIRNNFKLSAYDAIKNVHHHSLALSFDCVQADIRDVNFYFRRKSGFPKIKDSGIADVVISGKGISGTIHVESSSEKVSVFDVKDVNIKIDKLAFSLRDSKHNVLYSALRPLATGLIKKQIAKAAQDGIRGALEQLNAQLVDIRERLEEAEGDDDISRMDAIKSTFSAKKDQASSKAQGEKKGTFQFTAKRDSKIIDWSGPNSIVEKQGERAEAAKKSEGADWHSKAFDIVPTA